MAASVVWTLALFALPHVLLQVQADSGCEEGWVRFEDKCYHFSGDKTSMKASAAYECQTMDGHLVIIRSGSEQGFLAAWVAVNSWIGLQRDFLTPPRTSLDEERQNGTGSVMIPPRPEWTWLWVDRSYLWRGPKFWAHREPGHPAGREHCAELDLNRGSKWNNIPCGWQRPFVCQKDANTDIQCPASWEDFKVKSNKCFQTAKEAFGVNQATMYVDMDPDQQCRVSYLWFSCARGLLKACTADGLEPLWYTEKRKKSLDTCMYEVSSLCPPFVDQVDQAPGDVSSISQGVSGHESPALANVNDFPGPPKKCAGVKLS